MGPGKCPQTADARKRDHLKSRSNTRAEEAQRQSTSRRNGRSRCERQGLSGLRRRPSSNGSRSKAAHPGHVRYTPNQTSILHRRLKLGSAISTQTTTSLIALCNDWLNTRTGVMVDPKRPFVSHVPRRDAGSIFLPSRGLTLQRTLSLTVSRRRFHSLNPSHSLLCVVAAVLVSAFPTKSHQYRKPTDYNYEPTELERTKKAQCRC